MSSFSVRAVGRVIVKLGRNYSFTFQTASRGLFRLFQRKPLVIHQVLRIYNDFSSWRPDVPGIDNHGLAIAYFSLQVFLLALERWTST